MAYWLLKTEPETFSFEQLLKDQKTNWNGVRNYQARNFIKEMKVGDTALIYHSGKVKAVVGTAKVVKGPYPDFEGKGKEAVEWVQVDIAPIEAAATPVTLKTIKATKELGTMLLIRHTRLSVMPVNANQFKKIIQLSK